MKHLKKNVVFTAALAALFLIPDISRAVTVTDAYVDGVYNNPNVIIFSRQPAFAVEYKNSIDSFTVNVSTDALFRDTSSYIWSVSYSSFASAVEILNLGSSNYRLTFKYAGAAALALDTTYYWDIALNISGTTTYYPAQGAAPMSFHTVVSSVTFAATPANSELIIDWNNPFNPLLGGESGKTKFRYKVKDAVRNALIRIFTISGEYVATAKHFAPADGDYYKALTGQVYTAEWDGSDYLGAVVPPGIYLVNLTLEGEAKGITKRVVVIKK